MDLFNGDLDCGKLLLPTHIASFGQPRVRFQHLRQIFYKNIHVRGWFRVSSFNIEIRFSRQFNEMFLFLFYGQFFSLKFENSFSEEP